MYKTKILLKNQIDIQKSVQNISNCNKNQLQVKFQEKKLKLKFMETFKN